MKTNRTILIIIALLSLTALIFGWFNYFTNHSSAHSPLFFILGLFTWDDTLTLGLFLFVGSVILWIKNKPVWTGLFLSSYVGLRSLGEAFYSLNAQFSSVVRPWESFLVNLSSQTHFSVLEMQVVAQTFYTALSLAAWLVFLVYLKKYLQTKD